MALHWRSDDGVRGLDSNSSGGKNGCSVVTPACTLMHLRLKLPDPPVTNGPNAEQLDTHCPLSKDWAFLHTVHCESELEGPPLAIQHKWQLAGHEHAALFRGRTRLTHRLTHREASPQTRSVVVVGGLTANSDAALHAGRYAAHGLVADALLCRVMYESAGHVRHTRSDVTVDGEPSYSDTLQLAITPHVRSDEVVAATIWNSVPRAHVVTGSQTALERLDRNVPTGHAEQ
jgi:hypothetical protein